MAKKKTTARKGGAARPRKAANVAARSVGGGRAGAPSRGRKTKSGRHTENLRALGTAEREAFFETQDGERLVEVFERSWAIELVNVLLDLKKSTVKRVFEVVTAARKRAAVEVVTLYHYKEYLTNPLPLEVPAEGGETLPNHYAILGVSRDATTEELRQAFRLLQKAHDPHEYPPSARKASEARLLELDAAFRALDPPARRERTDRLLPSIRYLYPRREQSWLEAVQRILD